MLLRARFVLPDRFSAKSFSVPRSVFAVAALTFAGFVCLSTAAHAQLISLTFEGTASAPSVVEGIDGLPSGTPTPSLPFAAGDRFVGALTYDASTPISGDFGVSQQFDGALVSIFVHFFSPNGTSTTFSASSGAVTWSAFDPVGPIEIVNTGPVTGPAFSGFAPLDLSPDFEDPTGFFPSSTLPILNDVAHPADTLFLLFENPSGESFDVNSAFTYTTAVPEPSFRVALLVGALGAVGLRRSNPLGA